MINLVKAPCLDVSTKLFTKPLRLAIFKLFCAVIVLDTLRASCKKILQNLILQLFFQIRFLLFKNVEDSEPIISYKLEPQINKTSDVCHIYEHQFTINKNMPLYFYNGKNLIPIRVVD